MWVKICGITDPGAAAMAQAAGASAIGVVVAESPRQVTPVQALAIVEAIDIESYLLTVDDESDHVLSLAAEIGVTGVQPYGVAGAQTAAAARRAGLAVLRPVKVGVERPAIEDIPRDQMILTDTDLPQAHGGTGRPFDWSLVRGIGRPFVLAGGLTPDTVAEAVNLARPVGVDVSSGVESAPGKKDRRLVHTFIERANA